MNKINASTSSSLSDFHFTIEEQFIAAKTGLLADCEDVIYAGPHFVAVIDGATSKTDRRWDGKTGGRIAAETIAATFDQLPPDATARQAVDLFTSSIQSLYERYDAFDTLKANPVQRATAVFVAVSFSRKELWLVGDCQGITKYNATGNQRLNVEKSVDTIMANARALFLEAEIAQGKTIEELCQHDTGRAFILPLLERQMLFQNKLSANQYRFFVIDGFSVPDEGIRVIILDADTHTIILASDGYPDLKDTLAASEQSLQTLLENDPLLFRQYKSTKGLQKDNISFDDRSYLKLRLKKKISGHDGL